MAVEFELSGKPKIFRIVQRKLSGKVLSLLGEGLLALLVKSKRKFWSTLFFELLSLRILSGACNKNSTGCSGERFAK